MARWRQLTKAGGLAVGVAAAGAGAVLAAEKIAVGRLRVRPDPAADEPFGQLRGRSLTVLADDGVPLHAEIDGPDDAPVTIIFCHGYALDHNCWHYQRQALAGQARLVFWDQRGHGRSLKLAPGRPDELRGAGPGAGVPPDARAAADQALATDLAPYADTPERAPAPAVTGHVSIGQLGRDLAAVLAATAPGDGPVLLVGHSMGGMTIMALAGQHPELFGPPATDGAAARPAVAGTAAADPAVAGTAAAGGGGAAAGGGRVIGSVLVSTAASGIDLAGWLPAPLRFAGRQAAPVLLRGVAHGRPAQLVERGREAAGDLAFLTTRWMGFGDSDVGPALVEFAEHMVRATPVAVISEFYLALGEHDQRAALPALGQAPAVVLIGDRDRMVAPRLAGELAAGIPGADLVLVPGAGHLLIMERPGLVTGAITDLLARACPAVPPHPA